MGTATIVIGSILLLAVIVLAVVLVILWRAQAHLKSKTMDMVDDVYDDMDSAFSDLKRQNAAGITTQRLQTKVVDAASVRLGDSVLSRVPPSAETAHPPSTEPFCGGVDGSNMCGAVEGFAAQPSGGSTAPSASGVNSFVAITLSSLSNSTLKLRLG